MSQPTVYVALQSFGEFDLKPLKELQEAGFEVATNRLGRRLLPEEMPEALRGAQGVIAGVEPYGASLLEQLPDLRCISRCGAGLDSVDLAAAGRLKIAVLATPEEVVQPVAELTIAMILALARNLSLHGDDFRQGLWKKRSGHLLCEWTVGLIGYGRVGSAVERCLRPLGPRILVHDPAIAATRRLEGVEHLPLPDLLAQSDLVSLHAARDPREGPILGPQEFAQMKAGARLVNTARGHLVDEAALAQALSSGKLSGAALDVFQEEPYRGPLAGLPQVLLTPHVATLTPASRSRMELRAAENLIRFFRESALLGAAR